MKFYFQLKTTLPDLSNHHMRGQLDSLVHHVEEVMIFRKERDKALESIQCMNLLLPLL